MYMCTRVYKYIFFVAASYIPFWWFIRTFIPRLNPNEHPVCQVPTSCEYSIYPTISHIMPCYLNWYLHPF